MPPPTRRPRAAPSPSPPSTPSPPRPPQPPINARADVSAAVPLELSRATAATHPCVLDVPYGDDYWQKLDIYLPPQNAQQKGSGLPVFVCIHGGGWTHGYKE